MQKHKQTKNTLTSIMLRRPLPSISEHHKHMSQ